MTEPAASGNGWRAGRAGGRRECGKAPPLARRQNHDHLAAFESRFLLDFGDLRRIAFHPVEQLVAEILVRHFPAAKTKRDLNLVAFFEEPLDRAHLHVIVVIVDHRPQLDFFDLDDLLLLARLGRLLLRLILVLAEVENLADRRDRIWGDLYKIKPGLLRHGQSGVDFCDALVGAVFVDELNLADADLLVDARPLLGGGLRRSDWTTNGCSLLCCCDDIQLRTVWLPTHGRETPWHPTRTTMDVRPRCYSANAQDWEFLSASQRQCVAISCI